MSLYLKPGDEVECAIEKIGTLRNKVVAANVPATV
jgi:2-keto-4-pentenoate hydratase/2-oxohepta-3-ene-1,7-dioic acid hydratase in catechol pathway